LNKELFTFILILGIAIVSSLLLIIQPVFASPEQEVDNEKQSSGSESQETTDEEEQEVEPQPAEELQPAEDMPTPNNELPASEQEQQQQQLTLDIINANGLVPVNDTTVADGNGIAGGGTAAREVTCVSNSQGQTFCYEILKPDENCLKPINVEDPPLCKAGQ